jgi:hypothetical protein
LGQRIVEQIRRDVAQLVLRWFARLLPFVINSPRGNAPLRRILHIAQL